MPTSAAGGSTSAPSDLDSLSSSSGTWGSSPQRTPGVARPLSQGDARVGVDSDRLSARALRRRGRRAALRRNARRRRGGRPGLLQRRAVPTLDHSASAADRRPRKAGGHLRHPQRTDPSRCAADPQNRPGDRHASPRCLEPIRRDRRPLPDLCARAERAGELPLGHHSRGHHHRGARRPSIRSRCRRSTTWATGARSQAPSGQRARRDSESSAPVILRSLSTGGGKTPTDRGA